jgi:hypothetical protein
MNKDRLITDVFESECKDLEINADFIKKLHLFQVGFVNKNEEHIAFFGGHLLGVNKVRFTPQDENYWFEDLLQVNDYDLKENLHKLNGINPDFIVSSDVFNISAVWLTHAIYKSEKLTKQQKEQGMLDSILVMNFRFMTSRLAYYFKYSADPAIAEEVYARLSGKFAIKQYKTWLNVLVNRSQDTIAPTSIHYKTITTMSSNKAVADMINDCQGRIRDIIKNIYAVIDQVKKEGIRISTTSDVCTDFDGREILKDKVNGLNNYTLYLKSVVSDRNSFIKDELVNVIDKILNNLSYTLFVQTLEWVSDNYGKSKDGLIDNVVEEVMIHSYGYLEDNRGLLNNNINLINILAKLRGVYMSSRTTDPVLLDIREKCKEIVFLATKNKNKNIIPSLRTGLMLYLVSRAFTKHYYS